MTKIKWRIPNKYPIKTTEDCKRYLYLGYRLINNKGYTVRLDDSGEQVRSNIKRRKAYKFSNPNFWQVIDDEYNIIDMYEKEDSNVFTRFIRKIKRLIGYETALKTR